MTCPGPCVYCGATNYSLSCGGPSICPSCDCGNFGAAKVQAQGSTITTLNSEKEKLQIENTRLAMQVLKAQDIVKALVAALNLNDQLMTEIIRLSTNARPVNARLWRAKLSFDDQMKKLLGPPKPEKSILET